jgi:DNA polymerase III subunit delta'
MKSFEDVIGHAVLAEALGRAIKTDQVAHAYGFFGASGIGKRFMAQRFAEQLMQSQNLEPGKHPNFFVIDADADKKTGEKKSLSVEKIRALRSALSTTNTIEGRSVIIIEDADRMTVAAQNALLKTLEEPRSNTTIILLSTSQDALLETITSRLVGIRFNRAGHEEICEALQSRGAPRDLAHRLAGMSCGRPGVAIRLHEDTEYRKEVEEIVEDLEKMLSAGDARALVAAEKIAKASSREELNERLAHWLTRLHDFFIASLELQAGARTKTESWDDLALSRSPAGWQKALKGIVDVKQALAKNGNKTIGFEHLALSFSKTL